jgi:ABC-type bacteriocin/lantibiotic exporter with double-glycine peptidase domain
MNYLMNLTHHLEIAGALLFGGWCVLNGMTELGTVVAFISAIGRLHDPWGDLVNYFRDVTSTQVRYGLLVGAVRAFARPRAAQRT